MEADFLYLKTLLTGGKLDALFPKIPFSHWYANHCEQ